VGGMGGRSAGGFRIWGVERAAAGNGRLLWLWEGVLAGLDLGGGAKENAAALQRRGFRVDKMKGGLTKKCEENVWKRESPPLRL
jgi:hypothetical protein